MHPANITSAWQIPLQNAQRPETTTPPSTDRPLPRGAHTPAARPRPSPNNWSRLDGGRYATSRVLVIPIATHQPVDASPRASSSAARSPTCGGSSNPPTSAGAPARNSPLPRSSSTSSSGRRRPESISLHIFEAASAIRRLVTSMSL